MLTGEKTKSKRRVRESLKLIVGRDQWNWSIEGVPKRYLNLILHLVPDADIFLCETFKLTQ